MAAIHSTILTMKLFCLLVLFQSTSWVSTSEYSGLLSRLYKKAADSNRPLVLILDIDSLQSDQQKLAKQDIGKEIDLDHKAKHVHDLPKKKNRDAKILALPYRYQTESNIKPRLYKPVLSMAKKKKIQKAKAPPIIKSLLRISNNLRCEAKDECEEECDMKYDGYSQSNCIDKCEAKYECEEEVDPCEEDECEDECEGYQCQGSTKGWRLETEKPRCPDC